MTGKSVGIERFLLNLVPRISSLCHLSVTTSRPDLLADTDCRVVQIPRWTSNRASRLRWNLRMLTDREFRMHDALLCPTPEVPPIPGVAKVAVVHDLTPLRVPAAFSPRYKAAFWTGLQTLRWADRVVAVSQNTQSDLNAMGILPARRVVLIGEGPGVLPGHRRCEFGADLEPFVLYVGSHQPHKNLPRLLLAFHLIRDLGNLRLVVAGWGSATDTDRTIAAARRYDVHDRVVLLRDISDDQLSSLYRRCSAFVYPSLYEGFGLPVLEAMAHGAPVACSRVASLPEIIGDAGMMFNPYSSADIAGCLRRLLTDTDLAARFRRDALARASSFSWSAAADRLVAEIAAAVRERPH